MQLPKVGERFEGRFQIESVLGEGGFGTVYLAHDDTGRKVALKVLHPDEGVQYARATKARFEREVAVLARLRDPHVVTLYEHGVSAAGLLFMVFEYVRGRDLSEFLDSVDRLERRWVEHILRQVLSALREAHASGLIHRDLKPDNVRVFERDGDAMSVKLLDFGIARGTDDGHPSVTKTGELIGTPRYMSPEQLTGRPLTAASDIYSLGMVAMELLVGREALTGSSVGEQLGRLRSGHVFSPAELDRLGGPLLPIIQRMTARAPEDRFATATAVLAALDRLGEEKQISPDISSEYPPTWEVDPVPAQHPSSDPADQPAIAARHVVVGLAVAGLLVGIGLAALVMLYLHEPEPVPVQPTARRVANPLVRGQAPAAAPSSGSTDAGAAPEAPVDAGIADASAAPWAPLPNPRPSSGCGRQARPGSKLVKNTLRYVPVNYDPKHPHPVIIVMHTDRQSAGALFDVARFDELADRERLVVLLPTDSTLDEGYKAWRNRDDEDAIRAAFDAAAKDLCLDEGRVFVIGDGDGARVGTWLMCQPWVTAIAFNSWLHFQIHDPFAACEPLDIPVVWVNPKDSVQLPLDGSQPCGFGRKRIALAEQERIWRKRYSCSGERKTIFSHPVGECYEWDCETPLQSCMVEGGEGWPGSNMQIPLVCTHEPAAALFPTEERIWAFFREASPLKATD